MSNGFFESLPPRGSEIPNNTRTQNAVFFSFLSTLRHFPRRDEISSDFSLRIMRRAKQTHKVWMSSHGNIASLTVRSFYGRRVEKYCEDRPQHHAGGSKNYA